MIGYTIEIIKFYRKTWNFHNLVLWSEIKKKEEKLGNSQSPSFSVGLNTLLAPNLPVLASALLFNKSLIPIKGLRGKGFLQGKEEKNGPTINQHMQRHQKRLL